MAGEIATPGTGSQTRHHGAQIWRPHFPYGAQEGYLELVVRRYSEFRALCETGSRLRRVAACFGLPIILLTFNYFFGKRFSPTEAQAFIGTLGDHSIREPQNFEEQALKFVGRELYETFFYGYTKKQWGCEPCDLSASLLKRLPIRFNYDDSYFNDRFQGIPVRRLHGDHVEGLLGHENIEVKLGTPWVPAWARNFPMSFSPDR